MSFFIAFQNKSEHLNAPRHKGFGKVGLDCSGRLIPGYMFDGNGNVVPSIATISGKKPATRKKRLSNDCQTECDDKIEVIKNAQVPAKPRIKVAKISKKNQPINNGIKQKISVGNKKEVKSTDVLTDKKKVIISKKKRSISQSSVISEILNLEKYKKNSQLLGSILYNKFKNVDLEKEIAVFSDFDISILNKESTLHNFVLNEVSLTGLGVDFINSIKNRIESLNNENNNYALFENLNAGANDDEINPAWFPKYNQFENKPKEAIKHLLKVKKGDCLKALYRKDIGHIDIVWGENNENNKGFGLKHIVEKHGKEIEQIGFKIEDFIPIIVQFGDFKILKDTNKIELSGQMFRIIISKTAYVDGKKQNKVFVLSAFDLRPLWKKQKSSGLNGTYDGINFAKKPLLSKTLDLKKSRDLPKVAVASPKDGDKKPLSKNKVTKTIPKNQIINKKNETNTLNCAASTTNTGFKVDEPETETTVLVENNNKNSLANRIASRPVNQEYFEIYCKQIAAFLGKIERKPKESVFISLTGGRGSMKTRMCFQFMNALAQNYKVGHASIEEHPESALYFDKIDEYLNQTALNNIESPEIRTLNDLHELIARNDVIVIDSYTKMKEIFKGFEVDKDLRKKYNGKLFIVIFQQTTSGAMRGGSKSEFDADIVLFTKQFDNYEKNYIYADKNRYNKQQDLKYNIFNKKLEGAIIAENPIAKFKVNDN